VIIKLVNFHDYFVYFMIIDGCSRLSKKLGKENLRNLPVPLSVRSTLLFVELPQFCNLYHPPKANSGARNL